jgi:low temperature requirement protein LtrA
MSQRTLRAATHPRLRMPLGPRDPSERERAATPLELFFDLVSVVAVAFAAERLHHAIAEGISLEVVLSYALVFFGIWWAWVNFTWFASAYDNDDVLYRISVLVIMTGALVLAAGIPRAFDNHDFTLAVVGYVIMRFALVTQWLRVASDDSPRRRTALRFAVGITACQIGWLTLLLGPQWWPLIWAIFIPAEIAVPIWAERAERTSFHPEHIAERYGLFMIIVLGESVLAASLAFQTVITNGGLSPALLGVIVGSLLVLFAMWWIYFDRPEEHLLDSLPTAIAWSYVHLPIFAAVAAVGAGLVVGIEEASGHGHVGWMTVGLAIAIPLAVYLASLWLLYIRLIPDRFHQLTVPVAIAAVLAAAFTPAPVLAIGVVLAALVGLKTMLRLREQPATERTTA